METLVITCMDPRLNKYLDIEYLGEEGKRKYGSVEIWRNASGRLPAIQELLKSRAKRIILAPHTDCRAKEYMYEALKNNGKADGDAILKQAAGLLAGSRFGDRKEFDLMLDSKAEGFLKKGLEGHGISVELNRIDLSKLGEQKHSEDRLLVISNKTGTRSAEIARDAGKELTSCYIIQSPYLKDLDPDINLALGLGIKRINIAMKEGVPFKR